MRQLMHGVVALVLVATVTACQENRQSPVAVDLGPRSELSPAEMQAAFPNATSDPSTWPTEISNPSVQLKRWLGAPTLELIGSASMKGTYWRLSPMVQVEYRNRNGSYDMVSPYLPPEQGYFERSSFGAWPPSGHVFRRWQAPHREGICFKATGWVSFQVWMLDAGAKEWFTKEVARRGEVTHGCDQTSCVDKTETNVAFAAYDPYGSGSATAGCGEIDGTGGVGGGGTQYYPGDQTNGEMVDWSTGVGTGTPSNCPDAAPYVEYICFEFEWTTNSGETKRETRCGYVTVCG